ncbi:MAG: HAD family phosphatase [Elusimicrobia bacterium]|nr:HAD family phosphatase [Elusimicrobiota bacterium]
MIKAVFFDIGNVLLRFNAADILREVSEEIRRHPLRVAKYLWSSRIGERIELGQVSGRQLYALFRKELEYAGAYDRFRRLWCDHFTLERRSAALLKRVARTHKVYLLSNTNRLHYEFIRKRYAFARHAHGAILSYRLRLRKPDPAIYRAALKTARVRPEEAVFIDDLPENVEAARRLGLHALQFRGAPELRLQLARLGVLPRGR